MPSTRHRNRGSRCGRLNPARRFRGCRRCHRRMPARGGARGSVVRDLRRLRCLRCLRNHRIRCLRNHRKGPLLHRLPYRRQLPLQLGRFGEVLVALQEHARRADPGGQVGEDARTGWRHGVGVAVVPDAVAFETAGDMDVRDGLDGQFVQRLGGVLAAVDVVGVEVGHVDQEAYAGAVGEVVQELALGHLLARPGDQRRDVLHRERHGQRVLGDADVLAEDVEGVPGAGDGQQVPGLQARARR